MNLRIFVNRKNSAYKDKRNQMNEHSNIVVDNLWNDKVTSSNYPTQEQFQEHLFEQYKMLVESADQISTRRNLANSLFLTLHTLILGVFGFSYEKGPILSHKWLVIFPLLAVVALCYLWWRLLKSYRQLNTAKFKVIGEFETRLPSSPYWRAEWTLLGEGKNPQLYQPLSDIESGLPWFFVALYVMGAFTIWFLM